MAEKKLVLEIAGREVAISNPSKLYFPEAGHTKLDLVRYYLAVADGALRGMWGRPQILKRYPHGAGTEPFFQKRAPEKRPDWIEVATFTFPSGRTADEVVVRDAAQLAWVINLGCLDINPHPVRAPDLDHPDELRVDLDPVPGVPWSQIVEVASVTRAVLADHCLTGWPKTSGSRGVHVLVRIAPRWPYTEVRRAAIALAREVERRVPDLATSKWWKEERRGVFLDYNQNARDRTTASAYSVRPTPDARVSMPLTWDDLARCHPAAFTLSTVPTRFATHGDAHAAIDSHAGTLDSLLTLASEQTHAGHADAPWPPHFEKQPTESRRVSPSRRRSTIPVILIGQAKKKDDALAGLARWKSLHPAIASQLPPSAYLVDTMRGRSSAWYRVRVNLASIPESDRPAESAPDPDWDPRTEW